MGREIERKFLVKEGAWQPQNKGVLYRQGYLSVQNKKVVRVRVADGKGFLTVKGITEGISRLEFEYEIPEKDACRMLDTLCDLPLIEKTRYLEEHKGMIWEVDVFMGDNEGLVVAELELESVTQQFAIPEWIGREVSYDPRYFNFNLAAYPYPRWTESERESSKE